MRTAPRERKQLDPVSTRATILNAALELFSQKGFSGASIGDIAAKAGVTKSLVQYHFESKEYLWKQALKATVGEFLTKVDAFLEEEPSQSKISELVEHRFRLFQKNPDVLRMLAWASLDPSPLPEEATERAPRVHKRIQDIAQNTPHAGDAGQRMILSLSAVDGWLLFRRLYSNMTGVDLNNPEVDEAFIDFLLKVVWNRKEASHEA
jgi:AcrR family transcriptional regulator